MKKQCTVGFITTLSGRWPRELPEKRLAQYGAWLKKNLPDVRLVQYEQVAVNAANVEEAISLFRSAGVDVVIQLHGAFTGDDVCCAIADELRVPLILWGPYEPPFDRDARLFANALVSITMNAAALRRNGHICHYLYGDKEDARVQEKLLRLIRAFGVVRGLRGALLGMFGYRPTAFYNCAFDESLIRRTFGVRMEETGLKVVFDRMEQLPLHEVEADMQKISRAYDPSALPDQHLANHSKLYLAIKQVIAEQGYDFTTLKCWPEMGNLKTTPCAVIGRLADEGVHIICEGDVDAALTLMVQNYLTGQPGFIADMINMDETENTLTYWHCGQAPFSLLDESDGVSINNHPLAGQGTAIYGSLRQGPVTVARFCNIGGVYKLFLVRGEAVSTHRNTKGAMVNVKVAPPVRSILDQIIGEGVPHHYSLVWRDVADDMIAVAGLLGIEVLEL